MKLLVVITLAIFTAGCIEREIDTFEMWCDHLKGENDSSFTTISIDDNGIKDSYVDFLNMGHMEKVGNRAERMVWIDGDDLHLVNLSSFFAIEPEGFISQWENGINLAKRYLLEDADERCLYGTLTKYFNSLIIHSMETDGLGVEWTDNVTEITTDRKATMHMKSYKEIKAYFDKKDSQ